MRIDYSIPLARVEAHAERIIDRNWRKFFAFVLGEGPRATFAKVRSKHATARLVSDYHVVFAIGRDLDVKDNQSQEDGKSVCLGTRHPACAGVMLFHEDLVAGLTERPTHDVLAAVVRAAVMETGIDAGSLGGYNLYSDLSPPPECVNLVKRVAQLVNERPTDSPLTVSGALPDAGSVALSPPAWQSRSPRSERPRAKDQSRLGASVIAAGDYVRTQVIPALRRADVALRVVADFEPYVAEYARKQFGFDAAETDWRQALDYPGTEIAVIATYHDSHSVIAAEALRQRKKVILEKPPAVTADDLELLIGAASESGRFLDVGYNRRYAPFSRAAKRLWEEESGPTTISMVVKEVEIPPAHWYRWPKEGTRVTGNLCHWIDFAAYILGTDRAACELAVSPQALREPDEERAFTIVFDDGSIATILATQRGDPTLGVQEFIEIRRGSTSIQIDDFRRFVARRSGRILRRARRLRDKGHNAMYADMLNRIKNEETPRYTLADLHQTTTLMIIATEMVRTGENHVTLEPDWWLRRGADAE